MSSEHLRRSPDSRSPGGPPDSAPPGDGHHGQPGPDVPLYVISVAAELSGLHPQTLRAYDRMGLVIPGRTGGGGRRYSWRDVQLLREIAELTATGIGLEGVRRILELENRVAALRMRVAELEDQLSAAEYTLRQTIAGRTNLPAVLARPAPGGAAISVWRRNRF